MKDHSNDSTDFTDSQLTDFTQIASCAVGTPIERRRQSLRAKLEREKFEREKPGEDRFITTVRNLFGMAS